jgi:cytoskeleton protein RodZ
MDSTITLSDDSNNTMNQSEPLKKTGLGERLKSAREALRLTEKEAAARLHLNTAIITLMENENFLNGPPAAFLRGYLRSYARLLNLSENEITMTLKHLENSIPSSSTAIPVVTFKPKKYNERYLHWLTYLITLILFLLVGIWWSSHSHYVIADTQPKTAQATDNAALVAVQPSSTETPPAPVFTTGTPATMQPVASAQPPAAITPQAPAPSSPITVASAPPTSSTAISAEPTKKPALSRMKMAVPEPDIDNNANEE